MEKRTIHFDKVMDWAERRSAELRLTVHINIILYWGFSSEVWGKREVVTSSLLTTPLETNSHFPRRPSPPFHLFLFPPPSHSNLPFSFSFYSCITFHADTIPPLPFHISQSSGPFSISLFFSLCRRRQIILPNSLWITTRRLVLTRLVARLSLLSYQVGLSIPIYLPHVYHDIFAGPHTPAPTFFHNILPKPQTPTPTSLHDLLSNAS